MWSAFENQLLAQGLVTLRENIRLPRLVNRRVDMTGVRSVEVPVPAPVPSYAISGSDTAKTVTNPEPSTVTVEIDKHQGAGFTLDDLDRAKIRAGSMIETQASEAIKTLANDVNEDCLTKARQAVGTAVLSQQAAVFQDGTAGDGSGMEDMANAKIALDRMACPDDGRRFALLDSKAEAKALIQGVIVNSDQRGSSVTVRTGRIGYVYGVNVYGANQFMPEFTNGTMTTVAVNKANGYDKGHVGTITVDGTNTPAVGQLVSFGGNAFDADNVYVVASSTATTIVLNRPLEAAISNDDKVFTSASPRTMSLVGHPNFAAFASVRFEADSAIARSVPDPMSGLVLRLETLRRNKRTFYEWDLAWGFRTVYPQLALTLQAK